MSGVNTGNTTALLWDIFGLPARSKVSRDKFNQIVVLTPKELFDESDATIAAVTAVCEDVTPPNRPLLDPDKTNPCGCVIEQNPDNTMPTGCKA